MKRLIYLIGPPGAGKSTLMAELTYYVTRVPVDDGMPRDLLLVDGKAVAVELGKRRGAFSGTDALGMAIHPKAVAWLKETGYPVVLAEGQRLSTVAFLTAAVESGREVDLIYLNPPEDVCAERRAARGSNQKPQWIKGAATRAANLAAWAEEQPGIRVTRLGGYGSPEQLAELVRNTTRLPERLAVT